MFNSFFFLSLLFLFISFCFYSCRKIYISFVFQTIFHSFSYSYYKWKNTMFCSVFIFSILSLSISLLFRSLFSFTKFTNGFKVKRFVDEIHDLFICAVHSSLFVFKLKKAYTQPIHLYIVQCTGTLYRYKVIFLSFLFT